MTRIGLFCCYDFIRQRAAFAKGYILELGESDALVRCQVSMFYPAFLRNVHPGLFWPTTEI